MKMTVEEIRNKLVLLLKENTKHLQIGTDSYDNFEIKGKIKAMQGKKEVDGFYFASVVPKPKDVRFYFFPVYTHPDELGDLSPKLKKSLKGKSCFHFKDIDEEVEKELSALIKKSEEVYKKHKLI